jgi:hypothetical protein
VPAGGRHALQGVEARAAGGASPSRGDPSRAAVDREVGSSRFCPRTACGDAAGGAASVALQAASSQKRQGLPVELAAQLAAPRQWDLASLSKLGCKAAQQRAGPRAAQLHCTALAAPAPGPRAIPTRVGRPAYTTHATHHARLLTEPPPLPSLASVDGIHVTIQGKRVLNLASADFYALSSSKDALVRGLARPFARPASVCGLPLCAAAPWRAGRLAGRALCAIAPPCSGCALGRRHEGWAGGALGAAPGQADTTAGACLWLTSTPPPPPPPTTTTTRRCRRTPTPSSPSTASARAARAASMAPSMCTLTWRRSWRWVCCCCASTSTSTSQLSLVLPAGSTPACRQLAGVAAILGSAFPLAAPRCLRCGAAPFAAAPLVCRLCVLALGPQPRRGRRVTLEPVPGPWLGPGAGEQSPNHTHPSPALPRRRRNSWARRRQSFTATTSPPWRLSSLPLPTGRTCWWWTRRWGPLLLGGGGGLVEGAGGGGLVGGGLVCVGRWWWGQQRGGCIKSTAPASINPPRTSTRPCIMHPSYMQLQPSTHPPIHACLLFLQNSKQRRCGR